MLGLVVIVHGGTLAELACLKYDDKRYRDPLVDLPRLKAMRYEPTMREL
jgi:hypothetical protein